MNIGLLNLEPKYKNLALEKIRIYHQQKGDCVEDYFALNHYEKVYVSSIFPYTKKAIVPEGAICGGSGFNLTTVLPPKIEEIKPHLNFGFTTRGCPNNCPFCIVPRKEGDISIVGALRDLWNGTKDVLIVILDNNILATLDHFFEICQESIDYKVKLDFNQGLDHRRLTPSVVYALKSISHLEYRFAFDNPAYYDSVEQAIKLLQDGGINRSLWYVLVGFNTTPQEDLDRVNFLRERGQTVYVQRYNYLQGKFYVALARWCNQHHIFKAMSWEQFLNHPESKRRKYNKLVVAPLP